MASTARSLLLKNGKPLHQLLRGQALCRGGQRLKTLQPPLLSNQMAQVQWSVFAESHPVLQEGFFGSSLVDRAGVLRQERVKAARGGRQMVDDDDDDEMRDFDDDDVDIDEMEDLDEDDGFDSDELSDGDDFEDDDDDEGMGKRRKRF